MNKKGFSLIELIVVVAIFTIVIGIPYKMFIQELKITMRETGLSKASIEEIPSLEILRRDIETAGFGLPWNISNFTYSEAADSSLSLYSFNPAVFNDAPNNPPRAIVGKKDSLNKGFSYLVLKGTSFGLNKAAYHWSFIDKYGDLNVWDSTSTENYNNMSNGDRVIVMDVGTRTLQGTSMYYTISKNADLTDTVASDYGLPSLPQSVYLVYGIDTSDPRAPFNRIDYRLYHGGDTNSECAVGTYTLGRSIMRQTDGVIQSYPLLHCVADFQVAFGLDTNGDGDIDTWTQDLTTYSAKDIRNDLKQVRVYILIQNGIKDLHYNYPSDNVSVGETIQGNFVGDRDFDLNRIINYRHYRWKVIKIVAPPKNLE